MATPEKIYLGTASNRLPSLAGEKIWLIKHSWDCGWYWGFGYLRNADTSTHFDSEILARDSSLSTPALFIDPQYSPRAWWIIRDLFIQAYALQKAAEVYNHGGYQTAAAGEGKITSIIRDPSMVGRINSDLTQVLNTLWDFLCHHKWNKVKNMTEWKALVHKHGDEAYKHVQVVAEGVEKLLLHNDHVTPLFLSLHAELVASSNAHVFLRD